MEHKNQAFLGCVQTMKLQEMAVVLNNDCFTPEQEFQRCRKYKHSKRPLMQSKGIQTHNDDMSDDVMHDRDVARTTATSHDAQEGHKVAANTRKSTGSGTDLNAIGDRKTLEMLLRWALSICSGINDASSCPVALEGFGCPDRNRQAVAPSDNSSCPVALEGFGCPDRNSQAVAPSDDPSCPVPLQDFGCLNRNLQAVAPSDASSYPVQPCPSSPVPLQDLGCPTRNRHAVAPSDASSCPVPLQVFGCPNRNHQGVAQSYDQVCTPVNDAWVTAAQDGSLPPPLQFVDTITAPFQNNNFVRAEPLAPCLTRVKAEKTFDQTLAISDYLNENVVHTCEPNEAIRVTKEIKPEIMQIETEVEGDDQAVNGGFMEESEPQRDSIGFRNAVSTVERQPIAAVVVSASGLQAADYKACNSQTTPPSEGCPDNSEQEGAFTSDSSVQVVMCESEVQSVVNNSANRLANGQYECKQCGQQFKGTTCLISHLTIHNQGKGLECDTCGKKFVQIKSLKKHLLLHTNPELYESRYRNVMHCEFCNKRFSSSTALKLHVRIHTNEKPYECNICNTKFRQPGNLKRHSIVHTKIKQFKCSKCPNRYTQRESLNYHFLVHAGGWPYACEQCQRRFRCASELRKHLRAANHSSEVMPTETSAVDGNGDAKARPFKCSKCPKRFTQRGSLSYHFLIHAGEWPYECDQCQRRFRRVIELRKHLRTTKHSSEVTPKETTAVDGNGESTD